jgi:hypothetical protein
VLPKGSAPSGRTQLFIRSKSKLEKQDERTYYVGDMKGFFCVIYMIAASCVVAAPRVSLERAPEGGIQPQVVVDSKGAIHLLYYKGDAKTGNLFYTRRENDAWWKTLRVNSREGSAIAAGTIRGGQMAVGQGSRVHVAWNGSKPMPNSSHEGAPMLYARLNDAGTAFEPERDLMTFTGQLDGGGSVAADNKGNVYVAWHGSAAEAKKGEAGRAVFVAKSTDGGATFAKERQANAEPTGACGCCGLKAFADRNGALHILYRAATDVVNRSEILLVSNDGGNSFRKRHDDPWKVASCPMSSAAITEADDRVLTAWETAGQVHLGIVDGGKLSRVVPPGGAGKRKHPVAAASKTGDILLVWTDGTGWQRGGAVAWQLFDRTGKPLEERGREDGVPVWSFAAACAKPDGSFVIVY